MEKWVNGYGWRFCVACLVGLLFCGPYAGAGQVDVQSECRAEAAAGSPSRKPEPRLKEQNARQMAHYRTLMEDVRLEINEAQYNLDWLTEKIQRKQIRGQAIPAGLYSSVAHKKRKISALKETLVFYERALVRLAPAPPKIAPKKKCPGKQVEVKKAALKKGPAGKKGAGKAKVKAAVARKKEKPAVDHGQLGRDINAAGLSDWLELQTSSHGVRVATRLPILFPPGKAVLAKEYLPFLGKLAGLIKTHPVWVYVDGYADLDPIHTRQFPSNFELGATRAANVVHALIRNGAPPSVFKVASSGRYRFPRDKKMGSQKAMERYVHLRLVYDPQKSATVVKPLKISPVIH